MKLDRIGNGLHAVFADNGGTILATGNTPQEALQHFGDRVAKFYTEAKRQIESTVRVGSHCCGGNCHAESESTLRSLAERPHDTFSPVTTDTRDDRDFLDAV